MPSNQDFFKAPQPAAVLKHGILRRYVQVFASKTGSQSSGGKVIFLDGYAGPGMYETGDPASPMLAIQTGREISTSRNLRCVFVELDQAYYKQLVALLDEHAGDLDVEAHQGRIEDHIEPLIEQCGDVPLFAYLDPFGVGVPFDTMVTKVLGRSRHGHPKTEVLLNFSVPALDRIGGMITSTAKNRAATLDRMNVTLGGDWWQQVYLDTTGPDRVQAIVSEYRERLSKATGGWGGWTVPVSDKIGGRPDYLLMHFTQHPDGHWEFHQALSLATAEWRAASHAANPGWKEKMEALGQFTFEELEEPPPFEEDESAWKAEIDANVTAMVDRGERFVIQSRMGDVFGKALGIGREMHLRPALKRLHAEGRIQHKPPTKLQRYEVVPVSPPAGAS